jgi:SNF2 family DNA or RNA helicase
MGKSDEPQSVTEPPPTDRLRKYQRDGVAYLAGRKSALLADEMGLGKTVQVACAIDELMRHGKVDRTLIVVPSSLRLNWYRELTHWAPKLVVRLLQGDCADRLAYYALPIQVLITSYDHLREDAQHLPIDLTFDLAVLDEAQRIKNSNSTTALAARLIPRHRSWALTGTPLENHPSDLLSVFAYVDPSLQLQGLSRPEILESISSHVLRRRKRDVLPELPPIMTQEIPLELTGQQRQRYEEAWSERTGIASDARWSSNAFSLLSRLKQLCNYDPESGESVKCDALELIWEGMSEPTDKLLVFSQYVTTLDFVAERLSPRPLVFHGGLSEAERDKVLTEFREAVGPRMLLVSLRAGGVGLNLQEASAVVMFDRWWNPAVEVQAINRAHRFGRSSALDVYKFQVAESVEERIDAVLSEKQELFKEYVDDITWDGEHMIPAGELKQILR